MTTEQPPPQVGADPPAAETPAETAAGAVRDDGVHPRSTEVAEAGTGTRASAGEDAKAKAGEDAGAKASEDAKAKAGEDAEAGAKAGASRGEGAGEGAGERPPKPVRRWAGLRRGRGNKTAPTTPSGLRPAVPPRPASSQAAPTDQPSTRDPKTVGGSAGAASDADTAFPTNGSPADPIPPSTKAGKSSAQHTKPDKDQQDPTRFPDKDQREPAKTPDKDQQDRAKTDAGDGKTPSSSSDASTPAAATATNSAIAGDTKDAASAKSEGLKEKTGKDEAGEKNAGEKSEGEKSEPEAPTGKGIRRRKPKLPSTRPPGAPPDPWTAFAETSDRTPGRIRRASRRVVRALIHEYALVTYGSLLLAVLLTWPTLQYPLHTLPQDLGDPSRQAWQVAWAGHILITDPAQLWQSNAFFPEAYSFAFGNSMLGYAPAGMLGSGPLAAVLRYNILFVLAHALLAIGGYALIRQLGAGRTGAVVGAVAFAYAPWRLAQEGHLDIISAGGIPLALAMLARGHGWSMRYGFRPARRHAGWAMAGWLVAIWQVSLGFSLGLPFAYVLAVLIVVVGGAVLVRLVRRRSPRPVLGWRLLFTDLIGALIFAGVGLLIALPYLRVADTAPAGTEIKFFSPPLRALLIGPAESRIWGSPHSVPRQSLGWPSEMALLPGFVLYALALVGLVFSVWRMWQRLLLLVAVVVSVILTLGTTFFEGRWTYLPLFGHLPSSFGVRIPGRLMLWVTLLLAILAAGAVAEFVRRAEHLAAARMPPWPGPWLRLATLVPLALVLVETWNATAHPVVPDQPAAMRTITGPMLVLPTAALTDQTVMLWTTSRFQQVLNGSGGFAPQRQADLRRSVAAFPDRASVDYLRQLKVGTVLLLRSQVVGTPWERSGDVPVETLGIRREDIDDNTVVFYLN